jgi:hypothetical protein
MAWGSTHTVGAVETRVNDVGTNTLTSAIIVHITGASGLSL